VRGPDLHAFSDAYLAHVRSVHPEWPFPDMAIRNFAEATQRITGSTERLKTIGSVEIHHVSEDRIPDWLSFFDHDAFAGNPVDAVCYCVASHVIPRGEWGGLEARYWRDNRELMIELLRTGRAFGYLAYVNGKPVGWLNASKRSDCSMHRRGADVDPPDNEVISLVCFGIAPPYRGHRIVELLLDRAIDDAPARGARWFEAYPLSDQTDVDDDNWAGAETILTTRGFRLAETGELTNVMRLHVG
jgi:GNAT superfamily N-acetyltransferase